MSEVKRVQIADEQLTEQVQAHIKDGWQPFKSPSMFHISPSASPVHMVYLQAMVKTISN